MSIESIQGDIFNNTIIMSSMIKRAVDMVIENFQKWKEFSSKLKLKFANDQDEIKAFVYN